MMSGVPALGARALSPRHSTRGRVYSLLSNVEGKEKADASGRFAGAFGPPGRLTGAVELIIKAT
jgi:hypothetical protein